MQVHTFKKKTEFCLQNKPQKYKKGNLNRLEQSQQPMYKYKNLENIYEE